MTRTPKPSGRNKLSPKGQPLRQRSTATRNLRERILIVCEGKQTEPNYFNRFRVNIVVEVCGLGKSPLDIVKHAQNCQKNGDYDQIWVVFDYDNVPVNQFNQAIQVAQQSGIKVAYSNQCFELWYLLHFAYHNTPIDRQQYISKLSQYLGKPYEKNSSSVYDDLYPYQQTAIRNARNLLASYNHHNPAKNDPSTTVHLLVEELNRHIIP